MNSSNTFSETGNPPPPRLDHYITPDALADLIRRAKLEDVGPSSYDATTDNLLFADTPAFALLKSRRPGTLAGLALLQPITREFDPAVTVELLRHDGQSIDPGQTAAEFRGPLASILKLERTALNFVTHLSGVATLTRQFVDAVASTTAKIYDTRKTLPGLRALQKYAVACGGGHNHRLGLYDAVLVKDNHLAQLPLEDWPPRLLDAITRARNRSPAPTCIEVEVDSLHQLQILLTDVRNRLDVILLDNMSLEQMRQAVALRNQLAPTVQLEASGGVNLDTVTRIAYTGVERISVGAITHSAPALDLGLDIPEVPSDPQRSHA